MSKIRQILRLNQMMIISKNLKPARKMVAMKLRQNNYVRKRYKIEYKENFEYQP